MPNVVELPLHRLPDEELAIRAWEAVMAAGFDSSEHRALRREIERRMSARDTARPH